MKIIILFFILSIQSAFGQEQDLSNLGVDKSRRTQKHYYTYIDREHTTQENMKHIAGVYAVTWAIYPLTQLETFKDDGSFKKYGDNFGKIVFDQDEPFWNWIVHPLSGSQLFLYYRANGYNRIDSLTMSFISSTLFEFTVEIYTEPASIQDLYQTPILGAVLGVGIENLSLWLLNSGNSFGKVLGHIINPSTLFWYYEGKISLTPDFDGKGKVGLNFSMDF
ncbi:hypothetical protein A9Q84_11625 [Halobacteriovorax marinus]|uniref:DUF3943 domain-containing protein n=1 Tax=Halobacteriovorax marinus TaxID=97084 RepID=A0A1Y5F7U3_9BACT|nr:hypothetical protein A9Q84_11625 [Halobacteriovorax marinus]